MLDLLEGADRMAGNNYRAEDATGASTTPSLPALQPPKIPPETRHCPVPVSLGH